MTAALPACSCASSFLQTMGQAPVAGQPDYVILEAQPGSAELFKGPCQSASWRLVLGLLLHPEVTECS